MLIAGHEGMDIDRKKQHKTITNTKSIIGALGEVVKFFDSSMVSIYTNWCIFGLTMVWNELANHKQLCLNFVTREPLG